MGEQVQTPGQAALTAQLRALQAKALRGGRRSRAAAIRIVNERAGRTGIRPLATSTVSDWLHGRTPPDDFNRLWALVEVLEEWTGAADRTTSQGRVWWSARRQFWVELWRQAQPQPQPQPQPGRKKTEPISAQDRLISSQLDFSGYLEQKRRNFSGRQWLFSSVRAWALEQAESALLITGDPGVGKSAFMAELVRRTPGEELLGFHFCIAEDRSTLDPAVMVTHLSAMIAERLPAYRELLDLPQYRCLLQDDAVARDPGHALDQGIIALLRQLPVSTKRFIFLDGLDEALAEGETRNSILTLLASRLDRFPEWIRIIVAARPHPEVLVRLGEFRVVKIDAQQTENLSDVRELARNQLSAPQWRSRLDAAGMSVEEVLRRLTADDRGNFLYVTTVLKSIELGRYGLSDLGSLPPGLAGIYQMFFERLFTGHVTYERVRGLLEVMLAAQSALPLGILQATSGLEKSYELPSALRTLCTFLPERDDSYIFFHHTLADWLPDTKNPFRADPALGHTRLADGFLANLCQSEGSAHIPSLADPVSRYWDKYGLDHLGRSGGSLPTDLSISAFASVAVSAQDYLHALGAWTRRGIPPTMQSYVQSLLCERRFNDILTLVHLLKEVAMYYYSQDGLVRDRAVEGRTIYDIGGEATDSHMIFSALKVTGFAGAVVRAAKSFSDWVLSPRQADALTKEIQILRYMAGGFDVACWASHLSRGFEDMGACLSQELTELIDTPRPQGHEI
ncbi:hypothetical protein ACIRH0_03865 [Streptomyces sp. NPDC093675]|uniref:hypothetical protein n=1 Tax=Streptomyces sp. NPDC093675 TaxID=3366049 RepID=UPI00382DE70F